MGCRLEPHSADRKFVKCLHSTKSWNEPLKQHLPSGSRPILSPRRRPPCPSRLTRDIQDGLKQILTTGFEPSDWHLHGLVSHFVARENEAPWLEGTGNLMAANRKADSS